MIAAFLPYKWIAIGVAFAGLAGALGVQTLRVSGLKTDIAQLETDHAKAQLRAADAALALSEEHRATERRRVANQRKAQDDSAQKLAAARAARDAATAAAGRVSARVDALVAAIRSAAGNPAPAPGSTATEDPLDLLADVLRRADARAGLLADEADRRGAAGALCERLYDGLN